MNSGGNFYILEGSQTKGPFPLEQMRHMWRLGQVNKQTLYCEEGYTEWLPLSTLSELTEPLASSAPPVSAYGRLAAVEAHKSIEDSVAGGILKAVGILATIALIVGIVFAALR